MRRIFPPKNLEKYGAQNTHAPFFFFKIKLLLSICCLLVLPLLKSINKIFDSFLHNLLLSLVIYSINHTCFTLQIILFALKCIVLSKLFNLVSKKFSCIYTKTFGGKIWRNLHRVPPDNFIGKKSNSPSLKFLAKNYSSERL